MYRMKKKRMNVYRMKKMFTTKYRQIEVFTNSIFHHLGLKSKVL